MTNQSEGPAVGKAIEWEVPEGRVRLYVGFADKGPEAQANAQDLRLAGYVPATVLDAARAELATEREGRRHLEEAAELLKRRPTVLDGIQGLYDWMQDVESWKARDQSTTPAEALSAEEPAPVAEAEGRVTHESAFAAVGSLSLGVSEQRPHLERLSAYVNQQEAAEREALELRKELEALRGLPTYHDLLNRLCKAFGVPGSPTFEEAVKHIGRELSQLRDNCDSAIDRIDVERRYHEETKGYRQHAKQERDELKAKLSEAERKLARSELLLSKARPLCGFVGKLHTEPVLHPLVRGYVADWMAALVEAPTGGEPAKPAQQVDQKNLLGFRCPKCGSSYFTSSINPDKSMTRHCRGPYIPGSRHGEHYAGCDYTWLSKHDNAHGLWNEGEPQELLALADQKPATTESCPSCAGTGFYGGTRLGDEPCPECKGEGHREKPAQAEQWDQPGVIIGQGNGQWQSEATNPAGERGDLRAGDGIAHLTKLANPTPPQPQGDGVTSLESRLIAALNKLGNLGGILTADKPGYWFAKLAEELEKP